MEECFDCDKRPMRSLSDSANRRRTDNAMTIKKRDKMTNKDTQNNVQNTKDLATQTPRKSGLNSVNGKDDV